jgi:hypothetical protein
MNYEELNNELFRHAVADYYYLMNNNYPEKGSLKLVGDRYKLSGDQRTILYRGISAEINAIKRSNKITTEIKGKTLTIDGYNVLFTIMNYLLGRFVFISNDRICRDAGSLHGKFREKKVFQDSINILTDFLSDKSPEKIIFFLDAPVSHSALHKNLLEEKFHQSGLHTDGNVVRSPDYEIKRVLKGIIATSDTAIINNSELPVIDLPHMILKEKFNAVLFDLNRIIDD